jgi:hypothetical protein
MQQMIRDYELSRQALQCRIRELNSLLRDDTLMHKEREQLMRRRDLLVDETIEMLHILVELRCHDV